ncbi:DUF2306 domain-containing protein [Umezawaea endophytica]|uniref:DUF2306 domain-containing protein n=1 Tax=Umezawaea endophytica TaxID=1654476 RepID=A0A9X2VLA1_9PSEU|nr:DUF2306 domain-containing protein [Umezawaea endophytica]MCS7478586.1 DUF2306 domain-containing protein [Umezawaea endophytica]
MTTRKADWLVPTSLILLSLVPSVAGGVRVAELARGAEITPANERFFALPLPVVLHIVGATAFCVLGAFQFSPGIRRRHRGWHRWSGRVLVPAGLVAALTGLWMALGYPRPPGDGVLLTPLRLVFGSAMAAAIVLGFLAVRRRDFAAHRAWMIRGYAIGLGAGTQVFTHLPWVVAGVAPGEVTRAGLMALGWVVNVVFAEWVIRRKPASVRGGRAVVGASVGDSGGGRGDGVGSAG